MDLIVREGDSFWYYSQLFNINHKLIVDSNRALVPDQLLAGQVVRLPGFKAQDYHVKQGETFFSIAQRLGLSTDALLRANKHIDPLQLQAGMVIQVPERVTQRVVDTKQNYDYGQFLCDIQRLQILYPFIQVSEIGNSILGRSIPEVKIGSGDKKIHYNGSFHANEWITTAVMMTFINDYLLSLVNHVPIRGIDTAGFYTQAELSFVPMVNPDGVDLVLNGLPDEEPWRSRILELNKGSTDFSGWKANIRGVDLNDQFPAKWAEEKARNVKEPGPRDYGGEMPLSEPEAIAMAELTRRRQFAEVLAFHTQGQEIYWGFENLEPSEAAAIVQEFGRVSGYQPVRNIESFAGYKDWFIQEWHRPGFTVELGIGTNPLPLSQFDEIYKDVLGIFLASLYL